MKGHSILAKESPYSTKKSTASSYADERSLQKARILKRIASAFDTDLIRIEKPDCFTTEFEGENTLQSSQSLRGSSSSPTNTDSPYESSSPNQRDNSKLKVSGLRPPRHQATKAYGTHEKHDWNEEESEEDFKMKVVGGKY